LSEQILELEGEAKDAAIETWRHEMARARTVAHAEPALPLEVVERMTAYLVDPPAWHVTLVGLMAEGAAWRELLAGIARANEVCRQGLRHGAAPGGPARFRRLASDLRRAADLAESAASDQERREGGAA
jgi:hypothetical protein